MNIIKERREASLISTSLDHFLKARLNNFYMVQSIIHYLQEFSKNFWKAKPGIC